MSIRIINLNAISLWIRRYWIFITLNIIICDLTLIVGASAILMIVSWVLDFDRMGHMFFDVVWYGCWIDLALMLINLGFVSYYGYKVASWAFNKLSDMISKWWANCWMVRRYNELGSKYLNLSVRNKGYVWLAATHVSVIYWIIVQALPKITYPNPVLALLLAITAIPMLILFFIGAPISLGLLVASFWNDPEAKARIASYKKN